MVRSEVVDLVIQVMQDSFDLDTIEYRDDLSAADVAGWDSLSNIRFMVAVEQEFGRRLSMAQWQGLKTVGDLVDLLAGE